MPQEATLVQRLCEAPNPREVHDWEARDGYYVATCRVSAEDVPGLIEIARRWSDEDWPGDEDGLDIDADNVELLSVTAWRTLADLKASAAVQPLIEMQRALDDEFDDWTLEELPHVFGMIGESAIEPLLRAAQNDEEPELVRTTAARGLSLMAHYHSDTRERIVLCLTEMLADAVEDQIAFNTTLLSGLVDLKAVEAAEVIERAFSRNLLDVGMLGDWEEARQILGVESLGLKMPENPHNSIAQFRSGMGIGVFSDQPVFSFDEIDHDVEMAYYQRAYDMFSQSSEGQQAIDRHGGLHWFRSFLEFGINYLGETVDTMTLGTVREYILDFVPRKVSTEPESAAEIVGELTLFWEYLDRVHNLPEAKAIVEWLKSDGLVARLKKEMSDPANFGMAKSLFMMGQNAGFDMRSEADMARFMAAYNQSLLANRTPAPDEDQAFPVAEKSSQRRVGRNEPCPCGSGKKFKKCCARPPQHG